MKKFKPVLVSSFWGPRNIGDVIEGKIIEIDVTYESQFGESKYLQIETGGENPATMRVGYSAGLAGALEQLSLHDYVRITYNGEQFNPKTKRRFKSYSVEVAE